MGRPKLDPTATATATRVVDAAITAFASLGFDGATLADIAAAAGITRPSLLYHFASKERLYEASLARVFAAIGALIAGATADVGASGEHDLEEAIVARAQLLALVEGFAAFAVQEPATARLLLRAIVADDNPATRVLVISQAVPTIDAVCVLARRAGAGDAVDLRASVMAIVVDVLARAAAGDAATPLWGRGSPRELAERALFGQLLHTSPHTPPHTPPHTEY